MIIKNIIKLIAALFIVFLGYVAIANVTYEDKAAHVLAYIAGATAMIFGIIFSTFFIAKIMMEYGRRINFVPDDGLNIKQQSRQLEPSTHMIGQNNEKLKGGKGPITRI